MGTQLTERQEAEIAAAGRAPEDVISAVVGSAMYSAHHRFSDLRMLVIREVSTITSGLAVSRYYFSAEPKVVVDIVEHPERFKAEIAAKRAYCVRKGIRYALVTDAWDDEGVRKQLTPARVVPGKRPRTTADKPKRPRTVRKPATA